MTAEPTDRIVRIRRELAALGLSQPEYWILRHLAPNDLGADASGRTLAELNAALGPYLLPGDDLAADAAALLARALVARTPDARLHITPAGLAAHAGVKENLPAIRTRLGEDGPA
ncbi:hypothetical protein RMN57_10380 [Kitasatospora sp. CM 4170]|uniref:MarR family transcriptional regulator n=1 Tax=Kitasatospora aburaviensis TaxID=67265 RepID=A0ABW1EVH9_9ACTN|nr:hypothetical protein [Kitasatospora sp. CM 4170]WNM45092.1 hypothetical protein RMN57_10380 [Kitasatospora sp. CM 4170]